MSVTHAAITNQTPPPCQGRREANSVEQRRDRVEAAAAGIVAAATGAQR